MTGPNYIIFEQFREQRYKYKSGQLFRFRTESRFKMVDVTGQARHLLQIHLGDIDFHFFVNADGKVKKIYKVEIKLVAEV